MFAKSWRGLVLVGVPALADYNESLAVTYAYLSTAAMCSPGAEAPDTSSLEEWQCGAPCDAVPGMTDVRAIQSGLKNDAFGYVGKLNSVCTVVFRGTSDVAGWIQDLKSAILVDMDPQLVPCSYEGVTCKVGNGFMQNYMSVAEFVKGNLSAIGCGSGSKLSITGHSLGAAEAAIAMFDLLHEGYEMIDQYTFGQPRVGDATFAAAFDAAFGSNVWRVTHANDPVPMLPFQKMGFHHISTEVYYESSTRLGFKVCDGSGEDPTCNLGRWDDFGKALATCALFASRCPHLTYMKAIKTISMTGDTCTQPSSVVV